MQGSVLGDITAIMYMLAFLFGGLFISGKIFRRESIGVRLLLGGVLGIFMLQWLPAVFSLFMGFTMNSHMLAFGTLALLVLATGLVIKQNSAFNLKDIKITKGSFWVGALGVLILLVYFVILDSHTIPTVKDNIHTGQSTYGDMNMHLGFITSIANQGMFPPEYSILPGAKLCYPFLCDTVSSSLYLMGSSLRLAYMLPMMVAMTLVTGGFYLLAKSWLKDRSKATVAFVLFFLCGGFGFMYFMDGLKLDTSNFDRIFTAFYETPTNLVNEGNIRWVNVIADMLIPQRATLFGWAMLFPTLLVLYKAVFEDKKNYFLICGVLAGGLPMIHTHSFLALGFICVSWFIWNLGSNMLKDGGCEKLNLKAKTAIKIAVILAAIPTLLSALSAFLTLWANDPNVLEEEVRIYYTAMPAVCFLIGLVVSGAFLFVLNLINGRFKQLAQTWLVFLVLTLVLAVPQLLTWTFNQVKDGSMLKGHFNWGNLNDKYIWFYVKNIGVVALLAVPALWASRKTLFKTAAPALLIFYVAEFIVFQPNVYDNNKLLYVSYALVACVVASYMVDIYRTMAKNNIGGRQIIAAVTIFACTYSAVLTLQREMVSDYVLYDKNHVAAAEYIDENAPTDAVILTDDRHNNSVASLAGRNIVCGAGSFLYYHGLDYSQHKTNAMLIYMDPAKYQHLIQQYKIDYIMVSDYEKGSYNEFYKANAGQYPGYSSWLDESAIAGLYPLVYQNGTVHIYAVSKRAGNITNSY